MARHPYLEHEGPLALAHRGGASEAPENSPAAFHHAAALGLSHLETDVHATADGVCVVFHDEVLDRTTDRRGRIAEMTWAEVSKARIAGQEPIWRIEEMLVALPDAFINIDVKSAGAVAPLAKILRAHRALDRVLVGSFSHSRLQAMRAAMGPGLATSLSTREVVALLAGDTRVARGAVAAQIPDRAGRFPVATRRFVERAHRHGLAVHVWTVNDEQAMRRLLDLGVDGIVTDRPTLLKNVLVDRGQWARDS